MEMKWTVTAGELLQALTIIVAAFGVYNRLSLQIKTLETKLEPLWLQFISNKDTVRHWKEEHQEGD